MHIYYKISLLFFLYYTGSKEISVYKLINSMKISDLSLNLKVILKYQWKNCEIYEYWKSINIFNLWEAVKSYNLQYQNFKMISFLNVYTWQIIFIIIWNVESKCSNFESAKKRTLISYFLHLRRILSHFVFCLKCQTNSRDDISISDIDIKNQSLLKGKLVLLSSSSHLHCFISPLELLKR